MFCPRCGKPCGATDDGSADYCVHCGQSLASVDLDAARIAGGETRDEWLRAAIGERRKDHYLRVFARFESAGRAGVSWHWPAFFLTFYWLLYRKMWRNALIYFVLPYAVVIALGIFGSLLGEASASLVGLAFFAYWAAMFFVPALYANAWYYRHCQKKIAQARASSGDAQRQLGMLAGQGGTSNVALIVLLVVGMIAFVGVLAAIALPAYQDYTTRARLAEAVSTGNAAAASVAAYYDQHRTVPENLPAAGFTAALPPSIRAISLDGESGTLRITMASAPLEDQAVLLVPSLDESDKVVWQCMSDEIPAKYLPRPCLR